MNGNLSTASLERKVTFEVRRLIPVDWRVPPRVLARSAHACAKFAEPRALMAGMSSALQARVAAIAGGARMGSVSTNRASALPHVRAAEPLHFPEQEPESERMGQGRRHYNLCKALYEMLCQACVPEHTVGADQFVYFDAANPKRCLAPDAFVTLGLPDHDFDSYLAWEEGTPELAFEVLTFSDSLEQLSGNRNPATRSGAAGEGGDLTVPALRAPEKRRFFGAGGREPSRDNKGKNLAEKHFRPDSERWSFEEKLRRYRALGVRELVTFHVDAPSGERLRVWDRLDHDLVERVVEEDSTPCVTLGMTLLVGPVDAYPVGLRLARDAAGRDLVLTDREGRRAEETVRRRAEERVAALERQLHAKG